MSSNKTNSELPVAPDPDAAALVLRQFRIVFNAVKTHFRAVERDAGIGGAQLWALSVVQKTPGIGVNELARALDIHQSTASNLIKRLLERELLATARDGVDRRSVTLHILPAGEALLQRAPAPFTGVLPDALANLDPAALARLQKDLGALIHVLGGDEESGRLLLSDQI